MDFTLRTTLHSTNFICLYFHSFSSKYVLISLEISSLTQWLHLDVCCLISKGLDFPIIFLFVISTLIPLRSKDIHCVFFQILLIFKVCFMTLDMVYLGECPTCTWKKCTFGCSHSVLQTPVGSSWLMVSEPSIIFLTFFLLVL